MYEGFAQDSWKVNRKLHVDLGVRYTVITPFNALWRNMIVFDPQFYDPSKAVKIDPATGAVIAGSGDRYNGMAIPGTGWPDSAKGRFPEATAGAYDYLFRGGKINPGFSDTQYNQWQPRLGIAYEVTPKTVIRTGIGRCSVWRDDASDYTARICANVRFGFAGRDLAGKGHAIQLRESQHDISAVLVAA